MRPARFKDEVDELLGQGRELSTADFFAICQGMPQSSVYARIRSLLQAGRLSRTGRGIYVPVHKPHYHPVVTPWMEDVNRLLVDRCEGVNNCIFQKGGNLYVETARSDIPVIESTLREQYEKVIHKKDADAFPAPLDGYIVVGLLVSDAPVDRFSDISVPSIEKDLVDTLTDGEDGSRHFQRIMEVYPVNINRLRRYAARRGLSEELSARLAGLDSSRMEMFSRIQNYLYGTAITKAWVFGSFARREETPESDLDILVDYDKGAGVSLLDIIRYQRDLEKMIHREVDLVVDGTLRPFAVPSANRDKYLVYER
jgi:predicted nucleotidyltransferase